MWLTFLGSRAVFSFQGARRWHEFLSLFPTSSGLNSFLRDNGLPDTCWREFEEKQPQAHRLQMQTIFSQSSGGRKQAVVLDNQHLGYIVQCSPMVDEHFPSANKDIRLPELQIGQRPAW